MVLVCVWRMWSLTFYNQITQIKRDLQKIAVSTVISRFLAMACRSRAIAGDLSFLPIIAWDWESGPAAVGRILLFTSSSPPLQQLGLVERSCCCWPYPVVYFQFTSAPTAGTSRAVLLLLAVSCCLLPVHLRSNSWDCSPPLQQLGLVERSCCCGPYPVVYFQFTSAPTVGTSRAVLLLLAFTSPPTAETRRVTLLLLAAYCCLLPIHLHYKSWDCSPPLQQLRLGEWPCCCWLHTVVYFQFTSAPTAETRRVALLLLAAYCCLLPVHLPSNS
ncbi:hypothetical protein J6590_045765 [Homalodisca vitripennis]|nr:hypothetical protein J6590_045765 [Homalodisca vitripennis]